MVIDLQIDSAKQLYGGKETLWSLNLIFQPQSSA